MFKVLISSRLGSSHLGAHRTSARFARGPDQLEALLIVPRGSARLVIRGSAYLDSWIGIGLGLDSGSENQLSARLSRGQSSGLGSELSSGLS